jgi:hypothetical protein
MWRIRVLGKGFERSRKKSIEYKRANDGIAMNIKMILGKMVQRISIVVP